MSTQSSTANTVIHRGWKHSKILHLVLKCWWIWSQMQVMWPWHCYRKCWMEVDMKTQIRSCCRHWITFAAGVFNDCHNSVRYGTLRILGWYQIINAYNKVWFNFYFYFLLACLYSITVLFSFFFLDTFVLRLLGLLNITKLFIWLGLSDLFPSCWFHGMVTRVGFVWYQMLSPSSAIVCITSTSVCGLYAIDPTCRCDCRLRLLPWQSSMVRPRVL